MRYLLLGPRSHGVTRHGEALAGAMRTRLETSDPQALAAFLVQSDEPVHIHVTDHLLGDDEIAINQAIDVIAASRVHLTLHDIPQPAEGAERYARRARIYARLVEAAASIQVCSNAERAMLEGMTTCRGFGVVPLPIDVRKPVVADQSRIGVLGFTHPGKNPELAVEIAAQTGQDVILMGAVAPGHEGYARDLVKDGARVGVAVEITGFLDEDALDEAIATVAVPLAPYRHISASGSIGRWIATGRCPITFATPWAQELSDRAPWSVHVVAENNAAQAVREALENPEVTITGGRSDGLISTQDAKRLQAEFLRQVNDA